MRRKVCVGILFRPSVTDSDQILAFWGFCPRHMYGVGSLSREFWVGEAGIPYVACVALPLGGFLAGILHRSHGPHLSSSHISCPTSSQENNGPPTILLTALVGRQKHRRSSIVLYYIDQFNSIRHTLLLPIVLLLLFDYCCLSSSCLHAYTGDGGITRNSVGALDRA
jgi:hypothetical protein